MSAQNDNGNGCRDFVRIYLQGSLLAWRYDCSTKAQQGNTA